jgi:chemosensory pili system protein ChpC
MAHENDRIQCLLAQTGGLRLLLPAAAVAEVLAQATVESVVDAPDWLLGQVRWREGQAPLVSFAHLGEQDGEEPAVSGRVVVFKALGGNGKLPAIALSVSAFPRLMTITRDSLLADASEEPLPPGALMRALLGDEAVLLPDLDGIESRVAAALPVAGK